MIPQPLELDFAEKILDEFDWYSVCSSHKRWNSNSTNTFPCIKFDIRFELWDKCLPEDCGDLEYLVLDRFFEDMSLVNEENDWDFDLLTDINGYRMLCDVPIKDLQYDREGFEEDYEFAETQEEKEDILEEIRYVDSKLVDCVKKIVSFKKFVEGLKGYFDGFVVVVKEDGRYDFIHKDEYEDFKDEFGWKLWKEE